MNIIFKFLAKHYARSLIVVLGVVCGIILATSFVENMAYFATTAEAMDKAISNFFELFPTFLPLVVFIATLTMFYKMLLSSEIVIIQGAYMSTFQIARPLAIVSALLGLITTTVINPLSTRFSATGVGSYKIERIDGSIWLHEKLENGNIIIRSADLKSAPNGALAFSGATIIKQNALHQIIERIDANEIILANGKLSGKKVLILNSKGLERIGNWSLASNMAPESIVRQNTKPAHVSFWELPILVRNLRSIGIPTGAHVMQFLQLLFLPFTLVSMTILGVVFAQMRERRHFSFSRRFGFGIATCFVVYFLMQIMNAIGISGGVPPLFAAFFPPAIVLFFAGSRIIKSETL